MDKQEDVPPKTVKAQLVRLDDNLKQIERTQIAGIQRSPGTLPVLEAFQLFLENERKVAQKKLMRVTAVAMIAIVLTGISAGLYIRYALRNADARTDALAYTAAEMQQSLGTISQRQRTSDERLVQAARHLVAQRRSLAEQQQAAMQERESRSAEIMQLREQMESLLTAQASIQEMLAGTTARPATPSRQQGSPASARTRPARQQRPSTATPVSAQYEVVMLAPEGSSSGIRWMVPTVTNAPE